MEIFGVGNTDIFSATIQQTAQLESLANGALSKGIDLYMRQDLKALLKNLVDPSVWHRTHPIQPKHPPICEAMETSMILCVS